MADTKTTPSKPRKVIDITEPGKSAPPSSGKPIIVTNRPVLRQDPMMVPTAPDLPATDPAPATSHTARPIQPPGRSIDSLLAAAPAQPPKKPAKADATPPVQPTAAKPAIALDAPAVPVSPATAVVAAKPDAAVPAASPAKATPATPAAPSADGASPAAASTPSASAPAAPAPATEPAASSSIPEEESATAGAGEAGPGDAQLAPNKALEDARKKADEEKTARLAEQEKVIESKQYYLPISNTAQRRKGTRQALLWLLLVMLAALVWLDVVLDAGIISIPHLHAITHFFAQ